LIGKKEEEAEPLLAGRRRDSDQTAILALCALLLLPLSCSPADPTHPDVLLITVDTLRADYLSAYGFPLETSPQIDALAAAGVLFERAIAASSRTVPAHASIMTSRYTREHSVGHLNGKSALRDRVTLADLFRDAGYATAGFIGNILLTRNTGLGRGFDVFDDEIETPELNRPNIVERLAEDTTRRAIEWLAEEREAPAFLWVHYQDPHGPYTPPTEDEKRFDLPGPPGEKPLALGKSNLGTNSSGGIPPYQVLPGLRRASEYRSRYAGEIFYADRWIGELIAEVDARAGARGSVVLLTSDHGESFGENGRYFVHTYTSTPDVAHVPFIVRAPGLAPQRRLETVHHVDILPTLLDLVGLAVPADARGTALGPLIRGEATLPDRFVYCDIGSQLSAYRGEEFLQVFGLEGAWQEGDGISGAPRWRSLRWTPGTAWTPTPKEAELPGAIFDYAKRAEPIEHLPPPDPELIKQLRALGYVDK
jgi:arylsulfatase A-like enzyme